MKLWSCSLCCVCLLLLSAPWKTVKPMSDVSRCKLCGCPDGPDYGDPHECPPGFKVSPPPPTVPRVARSVDDLRVGMVVAYYVPNETDPAIYMLTDDWEDQFRAYALGDHYSDDWERSAAFLSDKPIWDGRLVILADPPARDWLVPATQMEALREAVDLSSRSGRRSQRIEDAARAVLDAAREVEHE